MGIVVRQVSTDDEYQAVARLRFEVCVQERGGRPRGADLQQGTLTDELDPLATIYAAYDGDSVVASGRVVPVHQLPTGSAWRSFYETALFPVPEDRQVLYGRLVVRGAHRGSMAIPQILVQGYERCRRDGVELGFLHCAPSLVPLYEVVGCRRYKKGVIDPDAGFRLPMVQLLGDVEHFARVRSPILNSVRRFAPNAALAQWFQENFAQFSQPASVRMLSEEDFLRTLSHHVNRESSPLFENLAPEQVQQFVRSATVLEVAAGDTLLRRGDSGSEMYLVLEGAVEIARVQDNGNRRVLGTLGYGQFFGEGGFLFGQPRSAEVTAIAASKLLAIGADSFSKLMEKKPELAAQLLLNLSRVLCQRLYSSH